MLKPLVPPVSQNTASMIIKKSKARPVMAELQLGKNRVYIIYIASVTLVMFGYYIPYVHLVSVFAQGKMITNFTFRM